MAECVFYYLNKRLGAKKGIVLEFMKGELAFADCSLGKLFPSSLS
jgi:hypothetical protein